MLWMIATMFFLDIAEECASYGSDEFIWVVYVFPLAIDFKMYLFIHTWSDLMTAKNEYLIECENLLRTRRAPAPEGQQGLDNYGEVEGNPVV